jgi:hypothetical protein
MHIHYLYIYVILILDQLKDNNEILPVIFNFFLEILDYKTRTNLRCKILVFYILIYMT